MAARKKVLVDKRRGIMLPIIRASERRREERRGNEGQIVSLSLIMMVVLRRDLQSWKKR